MAQRSFKGPFDPDAEVPAFAPQMSAFAPQMSAFAPQMSAFAQRVLDLVDAIPAGKVLAYGDIAEYLGAGGPRQVGSVMSTWGGAVPWHRVVHADGTPAPSHDGEVLRRLRADVTPMRGDRVDMRRARWNPDS